MGHKSLKRHLFIVAFIQMAILAEGLAAAAQSKSSSSSRGKSSSSSSSDFQARAEAREQSRWTLAEWLEQRDRNRMMDVWLSMNSPSPFEFMVGGGSNSNKTTTTTATTTTAVTNQYYSGELRAYAQFAGLTIEHQHLTEDAISDLSGMFNLRLLGNSLQNSSLTLHYGQRSRSVNNNGNTVTIKNLFSQASIQIYFSKYFGIDGFYRYYEPVRNDDLAQTVGGSLSQGGLFIDFKAIRIFGSWYKDQQNNTAGTNDSTITREGIVGGLKIFY